MPKAKRHPPTTAQRDQFIADAQRMIDAGELNPTAAEAGLDAALERSATRPKISGGKPA